jgi:hypothetical protein
MTGQRQLLAGPAARATAGSWATPAATVGAVVGVLVVAEADGDGFFFDGDGDGDAFFFAGFGALWRLIDPVLRRTEVGCFFSGWSLTPFAVAVWP